MQFTKLRISGFKSFVEPTELVIEPGMTGVVGPNGCGKSNLVEALRWVMGETSAKKMRGEEMDDVIFGGTALRPARSIAEVALVLDNAGRTAPAAFNDFVELEVSRRIERGAGSDYRVNGKSVRARDVQILFADNASGAQSPALVSQGRVGALINAKPSDRRQLLEEAAGISGLHARRHEAELRLRAAETNLTRLDDVLGAMDSQLSGLRKQARQAASYRSISDRIRKAEALLLRLKWQTLERQMLQARAGHQEAEGAVQGLMVAVTRASTRRTDAAAGLPEKRQAEAAAAAALQRLVLQRTQLETEEKRAADDIAQLQRRLEQIEGDIRREQALAADADEAIGRLAEERSELAAAQAGEAELASAAEEAKGEAAALVEERDRALSAATEQIAADEARRTGLDRQAGELRQRLAGLKKRRDELTLQQEALDREQARLPDGEELARALAEAEQALTAAKAAAEAAEAAKAEVERQAGADRMAAETARQAAREELAVADSAHAKLKAEADAIAALLAADGADLFPPLIDTVTVKRGYEQALAAALGEDVTAPLDEAAPLHWRQLPPLEASPLPAGAEPLSRRVKAPPVLDRALSHVGLVEDAATGARLAAELRPGQVLVTRDGGAWRWDGLSMAPGAPTPAAQRLKQRNRLQELTIEVDAAATVLAERRAAHEAARAAVERTDRDGRDAVAAAAAADRQARDALAKAFSALGQARERRARLVETLSGLESRRAALTTGLERALADVAEAEGQSAAATAALAELPDPAHGRARLAEAKAAVSAARAELAERQSVVDRLGREAAARARRLEAIAREEQSWQGRRSGTGDRVDELQRRAGEGRAELERLSRRPQEIDAEIRALLDRVAEAELARKRAADLLAALETGLADTEREQKQAEAQLADAREARARAEAAVGAVLQSQQALRERIAERLDSTPERLAHELGGGADEGEPADPAVLEGRLERLLRERETMGPVNLRADQEVAELEQQIGVMQSERDDLISALGRLRQGIAGLNKEARERLVASFDKVDSHFQTLFGRLFGGGRAHLQLTEAADPLEAGLEIYASPPGKKLQNLSLLSGGEQALTALALLFAVFLCTPAPICVLDEVDAPLDEANVGRFCDLVAEMARTSGTRFLIITHHRLTMARMDRLFGVTMAEQGVSTLVSVNLSAAEALRATA
jgi:chromosome segregation protein